MSIWLDKKYVNLNSSALRNFRWKSNNLANCSCPICGDSSTNKLKARCYFFEKGSSYFLYCHNCSASMSFKNFLKQYNTTLYDEYCQELFLEITTEVHRNNTKLPNVEMSKPKFIGVDIIMNGLKKISQLKHNHSAKLYVENRKIPTQYHHKLYYAPKFREWINTLLPDKFSLNSDEPRLVIPFFNKKKEVFVVQGRAFNPKIEPKYFSIVINEDYPKIFGLDTINFNKEYYITEGPFDSMFINNSIAMGGSDFVFNDTILPNLYTNGIVIYDNEPRNKEIVHKIENCIKRGVKVVIWPDNLHHKDINDMVMSGMNENEIKIIIKNNIHSSLDGLLRLKYWRKC
jgi:hypothetical protein